MDSPSFASRRKLPQIPDGEKPFTFWTLFTSKTEEHSRPNSTRTSVTEEMSSSFTDITLPRHHRDRENTPPVVKVKERDRTRARLARTVTNELDPNKYPMTSNYVKNWIVHNHSREEGFSAECTRCVDKKVDEIVKENASENSNSSHLKLRNPLMEKSISCLQSRLESDNAEKQEVVEQSIDFSSATSVQNFASPVFEADFENRFEMVSRHSNETNITPREFLNLHDDVYFKDGVRKTDFVIAYSTSEKDEKKSQKSEFRKRYFRRIREMGLQIEQLETGKTCDQKMNFICVHVPFDILAQYAEKLNFKQPVDECDQQEVNWSWNFQQRWLRCIPNIMYQEIPYKNESFFTAPFKANALSKFLGSENPATFFRIRHRIRIAHEILNTAEYGSRKKCEAGYERLQQSGAIAAAFPIHDGSYNLDEQVSHNCYLWNSRQVLKFYWASARQWFKYQPIDLIRDYFGEKMSLYFAWLGFYTGWLLIASVVASVVVLISVATISLNPPAQQICDSGEELVMCPQCDYGCESWYLSDTCYYAKVAYLFDNGATIFFGAFISFWSVFFLEFWKRTNAKLAYRWDVHDFQAEEERPRYQYIQKATKIKPNPVTGQKEPYFSERTQTMRIVVGIVTLLFMMSVVLVFVIGVIIYRSLIMEPLYDLSRSSDLWQEKYTPTIAVATGALIQVVLIQISGLVYTKVAEILTDWETHRTENEHENHLAFKIFVFQFLNQYSAVLYVAFFKGRFSGYPGNYTSAFGSDGRLEQCTNNDCLMEMAQNLAIIFVGKQIVNNTLEVGKPLLMRYINSFKMKSSGEHVKNHQIEDEFNLPPCPDLFEEYLEMVLQFGFVTIFSCSFPLAPVFALLNNFIEIRVDANKYVCQVRRGIPERAKNIGIWFELMAGISRVAVLCNAFLISFTSDFLNKVFYKHIKDEPELDGYILFNYPFAPNQYLEQQANGTEPCRYKGLRDEDGNLTDYYWKLFGLKLLFLLLFEHLVIIIGILIDLFVPDIPEELDLKIKREQFIARQTFSEVPTSHRNLTDENTWDNEPQQP